MKDETITALITALRSETAAGAITPESLGSLLQKIVDAIPSSGVKEALPVSPRYKLTAEIYDNALYLRGDIKEVIDAGYRPFLFRMSVKHNRYKDLSGNYTTYLPSRKGWHPFFRYGKISVDREGLVTIYGHHDGKIVYSEKGTIPDLLFDKFHYKYSERTGVCKIVNVPFGRKIVNCYRGHRFKYGIGFAPAQTGLTFDFSTLVSNIAEFHVYIYYDADMQSANVRFSQ